MGEGGGGERETEREKERERERERDRERERETERGSATDDKLSCCIVPYLAGTHSPARLIGIRVGSVLRGAGEVAQIYASPSWRPVVSELLSPRLLTVQITQRAWGSQKVGNRSVER